MLIVDARESESIDRALKKYKKKFEKVDGKYKLKKMEDITVNS